jgi:hypothetical protein
MTEPKEITPEQIHKALFTQLIVMLATSALQQLGKLVNPVTQKSEVDLEGAQAAIDLLDMLEAKTKGNVDKDEERMLRETIMGVKMNFVETMESTGGGESKEPAAPPPPVAEKAPEAKKPDGQEPKFHKKYG